MAKKIDRRALIKSGLAGGASFFLGNLASRFARPGRPNIIVIVSDALRSDVITQTVGSTTVMPNIVKLASRGSHYATCIAPSSWTLFSVPGILTSVSPLPNSPVIGPATGYFPDSAVNIAEILSQRAVSTAAVVKNPWLYQPPTTPAGKKKLFARGFQSYHAAYIHFVDNPLYEAFGGSKITHGYQPANMATDQVVNILQRRKTLADERPFFLYLHYMDTHEPYFPPEEFREKFLTTSPVPGVPDAHLTGSIRQLARQRGEKILLESDMPVIERAREMYLASANYVDSEIGRLFSFLRANDLFDRSIILFTSDHGEEFAEHGWIGHTRALYSETLNVPLVIAGPDVPRGKTFDNTVSSLDIAPALLDIARVDVPRDCFHGEPRAIIAGDGGGDVVSTTRFPPGDPIPEYVATSITTRTGKKYIRTTFLDPEGNPAKIRHEVFDHRRDPGEHHDLSADNLDYCLARSDLLDAAVAARSGSLGMTVEVPEELLETLKSLGYLN